MLTMQAVTDSMEPSSSPEDVGMHSTEYRNKGEAYLALSQLLDIIDSLNSIRIRLSITDDQIATYLNVCMNTYRKHKRDGYRSLSMNQIIEMLQLFMQSERVEFKPNKRVQSHSKNRTIPELCSDDDDDDDPHGD